MEYLQWINEHWLVFVGVFFVLDKIVKASPWPYDDFVVDMLWNALRVMLGRKKVEEA